MANKFLDDTGLKQVLTKIKGELDKKVAVSDGAVYSTENGGTLKFSMEFHNPNAEASNG